MFAETLSVFFDVAGLATSVTLDGSTVAAIFDNDHQLAPFTAAAVGGMASSQPMLTLPTTSVPAAPVGKTAVVGSTAYTIVEHQPDGVGISRLMLERA